MIVVREEISVDELLQRYRAGQRRFTNLMIREDTPNILVGVNLDGIQLIDCFIATSFRSASARNAIFRGNVKCCDFTEADLSGSDFRSAALCGTTFRRAIMDGADFTDAYNMGYDMAAGKSLIGKATTGRLPRVSKLVA